MQFRNKTKLTQQANKKYILLAPILKEIKFIAFFQLIIKFKTSSLLNPYLWSFQKQPVTFTLLQIGYKVARADKKELYCKLYAGELDMFV